MADIPTLARQLIEQHATDLGRDERLGKVARYLDGDHNPPYCPKAAKAEFKELARKSITNWLPLISDTFSKGLWVDGYRPASTATNAAPWAYWQINGLDARQSIAHRGALEYGTAYVMVLPGAENVPVIRPLSPLRTSALYADPDDEFPEVGLVLRGATSTGDQLIDILDAVSVHHFMVPKDSDVPRSLGDEKHGLGVTPMVRFRNRLDGEAKGIIAPLIPIQDRASDAVFTLAIAIQYASFRQRYATGLSIPSDPKTGKPTEPFEANADRLWVTPNEAAKFGDFAQTETSGHIKNYESAVSTLAAIAQCPPHLLLGDLVNLSADALAAAEASMSRKTDEFATIFGESWESVLRLAAVAAGDELSAEDLAAQVRWRDTEARSLAATVDALGKMSQMLMVPAEALWERIPGVTDQDVTRWREMAQSADGVSQLAATLNRQAAPVDPAAPPEAGTVDVGQAA